VEQVLTIHLNTSTVKETDGTVTGTITRSGSTDAALVVYLTSDDISEVTVPTSVVIAAGQSTATFTATIVNDATVDGMQKATLTAYADNATSGSASIYVLDAQSLPTLSISNASAQEGACSLNFTVTLSAPASSAVTFLYYTSAGTATADVDYSTRSGSFTIAAGQTTAVISIAVFNDAVAEADETFTVNLSNVSGANISNAVATGTILNDDGSTSTTSGGAGTTVALYDSATGIWRLKNTNAGGKADSLFTFGATGSNWVAISGDWNGDGVETVGLYNKSTSTFYLKNSNTSGDADITFQLGSAGTSYSPIVGDWNNDGIDTVGVYNGATSTFMLVNANEAGASTTTFIYGAAGLGWKPIAGDWNGDGYDTVGLYAGSTSMFYLKNSLSGGKADSKFQFGAANGGYTALAGDWNGDGVDTIGLYHATSSTYFLKNSLSGGKADSKFQYGPQNCSWAPVVGNWDGAGGTSSSLLADGGAVAASANTAVVTTDNLTSTVDAAIARLAAAYSLNTDQIATLKSVTFAIADLNGSQLGVTVGNTVSIDLNAAGHGWYVDATPADDAEFVASSSNSEKTAVDANAVDKIDLLTVVEHELSHVLGEKDAYDVSDELMSATLGVGTRRDAYADSVDAVLASI
jgi:hypothetical protein